VNNNVTSHNDIRFVDVAPLGDAAAVVVGEMVHRY
jgi:hypothetical protein